MASLGNAAVLAVHGRGESLKERANLQLCACRTTGGAIQQQDTPVSLTCTLCISSALYKQTCTCCVRNVDLPSLRQRLCSSLRCIPAATAAAQPPATIHRKHEKITNICICGQKQKLTGVTKKKGHHPPDTNPTNDHSTTRAGDARFDINYLRMYFSNKGQGVYSVVAAASNI